MRLLLDHNLSYRLVGTLADLYPGSQHVRQLGLTTADDRVLWEFAKERGLAIVSKDTDFYYRSLLLGCPPKVWSGFG